MSDIAREIIEVQESIASDRSMFEQQWDEIAPLLLPRQNQFFDEQTQQGEKKSQKKFDDTATLALERFAAAKESVRTPRNSQWHTIKPLDEALQDNQAVMEWCDKYTKFLFRQRYRPKANYAGQQHECYMSDGAFGSSVMIVEDRVGDGAFYRSSHLSEHYFLQNYQGIIDRDYRRYRMTAQQAVEEFGYSEVPEKIQQAYDKKKMDKFEFIHCVTPDDGNESKGERDFISFHVAVEGRKLIRRGFYKTFPFIIDRHLVGPNETYGRSPAMAVLSEIKMLNAMRKTDIRARHLAIDPPILAADQATIRKVSLKPNAINYGTLDAAGNPLLRHFNTDGRIDISVDTLEQSRRVINDAFYVTLFQILVDSPAMTATEVLQRAQEKAALISPVMTNDALGRLIERETAIYEEYGIFEDDSPLALPDELKERDGQINIEYTGPLAKSQRAEDALATERTVQALLPLAQIDPSILAKINWSEYAEILRDANGAPAKLFFSDEELAAKQEAQAQAQGLQQAIQAAPQVAGAIKDIAQANSYGQ